MRKQGHIQWFSGGDGMLQEFGTGNRYRITEWSFPKTHYKVTYEAGKASRHGKMLTKDVTIKTRHFPGLFVDHPTIQDPACEVVRYKRDVTVTFDVDENSNVTNIKIDKKQKKDIVMSEHLVGILDGYMSINTLEASWKTWFEHRERNLSRLLEEIEAA